MQKITDKITLLFANYRGIGPADEKNISKKLFIKKFGIENVNFIRLNKL